MIDQSVGGTIVNRVQKMVDDTLVSKIQPLVLQIHEEQSSKKPVNSNANASIPSDVKSLPSVSYAYLNNPHGGRDYMDSVAPNYVTSHAIRTDVTPNLYQISYVKHHASTLAPAYRAEDYPNVQTLYYQTIEYSTPPIPP